MNVKSLFGPACVVIGGACLAGSLAVAQPTKDSKPAGVQPEMKLPAGWTEADMAACMAAATPGEQHAHLAKSVGVWHGKTTMWMGPGTEPMESECVQTVTGMMDGRYTRAEMSGDMPGMGPFNGFGLYGYDNVSGKFVSSWVDNCSTGIMQGVGELSSDGSTMTWTFKYNCPITKKPTVLREIERDSGPNKKTLEMFGTDPKSGKDYQMMKIEFTRKT